MGNEHSDLVADEVHAARKAFDSGRTRSLGWRESQLDALADILTHDAADLVTALHADMSKPPVEAHFTDIRFTLTEIRHIRRNLRRWMAPRRARLRLQDMPGSGRVVAEPLGLSLVISPWNYPVQLTLSPLAASIAAGNAVVLKPSEMVPETTRLLSSLLRERLDPDAIKVIEGGPEVSTALLEQRFDHIFFTGSTQVGRIVAAAAAKHLTPTILELGGKSPVVVGSDADIEVAARRIAWGKGVNAGQTCIAPDYVLVDRSRRDELIDGIVTAFSDFYGADPVRSADLAAIVNDRHVARVEKLLDDHGGTLATGGVVDHRTRKVSPTVVVDPDPDSALMQEEIFAPILPVLTVDRLQNAIDFINERPKPLALYVFGGGDTVDRVVASTSSGGVCINQVMMHIGPPDLPFGGVGDSGQGRYHGRSGFEQLSNLKSVFDRPLRPELSFIYPPYTKLKTMLLGR